MNKKVLPIIIGAIILIGVIIFVSFLFFKNKKTEVSTVESFTLTLGEEKEIIGGPMMRFTGVISDSRCPSDVDCVWAGLANIKVSLSPYENDSGSYMDKLYQLIIPGGNPDYFTGSCLSNSNCNNYVIIPGMDVALFFTKLDPYPISKNEVDKSKYVAHFSLKQLKPEWETIALPTEGRPDEVAPGPIKQECQSRMDEYAKGQQFKDKKFNLCELLESKVGSTSAQCPNGLSPQGCSICKIKCR